MNMKLVICSELEGTEKEPLMVYPNVELFKSAFVFTYLLTSWCRILFEKMIVTQLIECSSQCSQKHTIGPYPEPAESSLPHRSLSP
jgi:hypothetical protein